MTTLLDTPVSVGVRHNEPDPEGVQQAFARSGYRLEEALADLTDNSLDADAHHVLIRFIRSAEAIERLVVADDGCGIPRDRIDACMQFGARIPHRSGDRGKYGIGLKSASFSQARSLTVISRRAGQVTGRRWTVDSIRQGWLLDELDEKASTQLIDLDWGSVSTRRQGTLIVWDQIDRIRPEAGTIEPALNRIFRTLPTHLGMVFHRFLRDETLRIEVDSLDSTSNVRGLVYEVHPLDPFGYTRSGRTDYPKSIFVSPGGVQLELRCHIWPPKSTQPEYRLGGRAAQRQGFYFYRNDRLIQAGGWNGWRDEEAEPHLSLARVQIDVPVSLDAAFGLNIQKSSVDVGPGFKRLLDSARQGEWTLRDYIRDADDTYRNAERRSSPYAQAVPGPGVPAQLRRMVAAHLLAGNQQANPIRILWRTLPPGEVFHIDRETSRLILNRRYRVLMSAGQDGTVIKLMTFLLLRDEFNRERVRSARAEWLSALNEMLLTAIGKHQ